MANEINFRGKTINYDARPDYWKLIESGDWEPETFDVLDRLIKPGVKVIDIGAWQGAISIYSRFLGAEVHAIEPDPVAYKHMLSNLIVNGILSGQFVHRYNCAISDVNGTAELNSMVSEFGNSESSLVNRGLIKSTSTVSVWTLPEFLKNNGIELTSTDFIKIDIEGGEVACLHGCLDFLKEVKPNMFLALHPFWIFDFEQFAQWIIDELFPIYNVINPRRMDVIMAPEDFMININSMNHAYLFEHKDK